MSYKHLSANMSIKNPGVTYKVCLVYTWCLSRIFRKDMTDIIGHMGAGFELGDVWDMIMFEWHCGRTPNTHLYISNIWSYSFEKDVAFNYSQKGYFFYIHIPFLCGNGIVYSRWQLLCSYHSLNHRLTDNSPFSLTARKDCCVLFSLSLGWHSFQMIQPWRKEMHVEIKYNLDIIFIIFSA